MYLIFLFYVFPIQHFWWAYQETRYRLKNDISLFNSGKKRSKKLELIDNSLIAHQIKDKFQYFLDKMEIRKDLLFIYDGEWGLCKSFGLNAFKRCEAALLIMPGFYEVDQKACNWLIKHEIGYIKYNFKFKLYFFAAIMHLVIFSFAFLVLPLNAILFLGLPVACTIAGILCQVWLRNKVDDFAIAHSTDEELKGGRRYFKVMQENYITYCQPSWRIFRILSFDNDGRISFFESPFAKRLDKIEKALKERRIKIDEKTEEQLIEKFRTFNNAS